MPQSLLPKLNVVSGMTTAPRKTPTLAQSYRSVVDAGFDPIVFAEPECELDVLPEGAAVAELERRYGCWHNWYAMAKYLCEQGTEYVATFQDDIEMGPVAYGMAQRFAAAWPEECGVMSFYTPGTWHRTETGWIKIVTTSLWGAVGWLFRTDQLRELLETPVLKTWRGFRMPVDIPKPLIANLDTAIGRALEAKGWHCYMHRPALAQHIGETSTIGVKSLTDARKSFDVLEGYPEVIGLDTTSPAWRERVDETHWLFLRERYVKPEDTGELLDVGGGVSEGNRYLGWLPQFQRTSVEIKNGSHFMRGVEVIDADFRAWEPGRQWDIVLCMDVLQDIPESERAAFCEKVFATARRQAILSVPVKTIHAVQPEQVFGRQPSHYLYVTGGPGNPARMMANYLLGDPGKT